MRHFITVLFSSIMMLSFFPITTSAQKAMFQQALAEQRKPGLAYQARKKVDLVLYEMTKQKILDYCKANNYKIISSSEIKSTSKGIPLVKYLLIYDIMPMSEYRQYENELQILKNGGMLDYTHSLSKFPTDEKSRKKAEKLFEKAEKNGNLEDYHDAAQLGHPMARVKEARMHMNLRTNTQNEKMARQMADELILLDDPKIWEATYDMMSKDGKAYVDWRQGKTKNVPIRFLWQYKGKEIVLKQLRESAEAGNTSAQKELGKQLWHGQLAAQDKKEAVKWLLPLVNDDPSLRDYIFLAKGEGLYDGIIPTEWYSNYQPSQLINDAAKQGNKEAKLLLSLKSDNAELLPEIEKGNTQAAVLLDKYLNKSYSVREKETLQLLKYASKTKYDKYGADVKSLEEVYQEAVKYYKSGKTGSFDNRDNVAQKFYDFYSKYPQYDKKKMVKKAKVVVDFCNVVEALYSLREDPQIWENKRSGLVGTQPVRNYGTEDYIYNKIDEAVAISNKQKADPMMGGFFSKSISLLNQKKNRVKEFVKSDLEVYNSKLNEYSAYKKKLDDIERANAMKVPSIKKVTEGSHGRFLDSDNDYDDYDFYEFSDGIKVSVHHRYRKGDVNYYYFEPIGTVARYTTAKDAADAGWVYKKMKVVRTVGRIE